MTGEDLECICDTRLSTLEGLIGSDDLAHPVVDGLQVPRVEGGTLGELEVVVEAVVDRRADGESCAGPEAEHRLGEHVGGRVPQRLEATVGAGRDNLDGGAVGERYEQVALRAIDDGGNGVLGQAGPDVDGQVGRGRPGWKGSLGPVGQRDGDVGHGHRGYLPARVALPMGLGDGPMQLLSRRCR